MPNCTASGGRIHINTVFRAAKASSTKCPIQADAVTRDEPNCCTYDPNDCKINLNFTDVPTVFSDCSGAVTCSKQVTWQPTTSLCANNFLSFTNYMCMTYYCFPTSDTVEFCDTSGKDVQATTSYFYNDGYPSGISHSGCCACVISPSAASATIDIEIIDLKLYDATATCLQTIYVIENSNTTIFNCSSNNAYTITKLLTSADPVTVTLKSNASATGNGKAWFRAKVSNGGMSTTCSRLALCPGEIATTAVITSTTTSITTITNSNNNGQQGTTSVTTSTTSGQTAEETLLFGLSVKMSAIVIAGVAFILLLLGLLFYLLCYYHGRSKSFDVSRTKPTSEIQTSDSSHNQLQHDYISPKHIRLDSVSQSQLRTVPSSPPPYYSTGSDVIVSKPPISVDFTDRFSEYHSEGHVPKPIKTGMFVYRPFENRSLLTAYSRRPSFPRVESP